MATLSQYLTYTRRLLHDSTGQYYSDAQLTDYINTARNRVCADTRCNRTIQSIWLSTGVESYAFGSVTGFNVTNGGSGYVTAPTVVITPAVGDPGTGAAATAVISNGAVTQINITSGGTGYLTAPTISFTGGSGANAAATATILSANTYDVLGIGLLWGMTRIQLDWMPFSQFTTNLRAWNTFNQRPSAFTVYGQKILYVGAIPDQPYSCEFDTSMSPTTLVNTTDADTIVFPYDQPIPYYAAYMAKLQEQSMEDAAKMEAQYIKMCRDAVRSSFTRRIPSMYTAGV